MPGSTTSVSPDDPHHRPAGDRPATQHPQSVIDDAVQAFTVTASVTDDDGTAVLVVALAGELDMSTAPDLLDAVAAAVDAANRAALPSVRFELHDLTFIDASGLRALIHVASDRVVQIAGARPAVRRLFDITGIPAGRADFRLE